LGTVRIDLVDTVRTALHLDGLAVLFRPTIVSLDTAFCIRPADVGSLRVQGYWPVIAAHVLRTDRRIAIVLAHPGPIDCHPFASPLPDNADLPALMDVYQIRSLDADVSLSFHKLTFRSPRYDSSSLIPDASAGPRAPDVSHIFFVPVYIPVYVGS